MVVRKSSWCNSQTSKCFALEYDKTTFGVFIRIMTISRILSLLLENTFSLHQSKSFM